MAKLPRDLDANDLIKFLMQNGFIITRQKGSHIRLSKEEEKTTHHITIPNHSPLKVGTLNNILNELTIIFNCTKQELLEMIKV